MRPPRVFRPIVAGLSAAAIATAGAVTWSSHDGPKPDAQQLTAVEKGRQGHQPGSNADARTGTQKPAATDVILAVHGGAGALDPEETSEEEAKAYRSALEHALEAGYAKLRDGGSSVDGVEAAIMVLEDNPLFNAGKGAVFNTNAGHTLDSSIMNGANLQAGAVAGVKRVKNPIAAARLVMEESPHVMLAGQGADTFAREHGLTMVTQDYYYTQRRWEALMEAKDEARDNRNQGKSGQTEPAPGATGTVGAVALDTDGDLAAGTSTGGLTNKAVGRIGDSPIIGAGTYANNKTAAISATGKGEVFIRGTAAVDISALMQYGHAKVADAAHRVVVEKLPPLGGTGAVIALDSHGRLATPYSSEGLLRGWVTADGDIVTKIFYRD